MYGVFKSQFPVINYASILQVRLEPTVYFTLVLRSACWVKYKANHPIECTRKSSCIYLAVYNFYRNEIVLIAVSSVEQKHSICVECSKFKGDIQIVLLSLQSCKKKKKLYSISSIIYKTSSAKTLQIRFITLESRLNSITRVSKGRE